MEGIEQIEALHAERKQKGTGMDEEAYLIAVCQLNLLQRIADAQERIARNTCWKITEVKPLEENQCVASR